jgi:HPt (histidine-containing phosphotransfer) domain-containing protein
MLGVMAESVDPTSDAAVQSPLDPELHAEFREALGDAALEVEAEFLVDAATLMAELRAGLDELRFADLRSAAHALKSTSGVVGARRLALLCDRLQTVSDDEDPERVRRWLDDASAELGRVGDALSTAG